MRAESCIFGRAYLFLVIFSNIVRLLGLHSAQHADQLCKLQDTSIYKSYWSRLPELKRLPQCLASYNSVRDTPQKLSPCQRQTPT